MSNRYGKLVDGAIAYAPKNLLVGGTIYAMPTEEQYLASGYCHVIDEMPTTDDAHYAVATGWTQGGAVIKRVYEVKPIAVTEADYDAAMEQHLTDERIARGYTTREPSDYAGSSVPRFARDAADWISHRDEVMEYALAVINEYKATGIAPSLAEFKAALPVIKWTIDGEGV